MEFQTEEIPLKTTLFIIFETDSKSLQLVTLRTKETQVKFEKRNWETVMTLSEAHPW